MKKALDDVSNTIQFDKNQVWKDVLYLQKQN